MNDKQLKELGLTDEQIAEVNKLHKEFIDRDYVPFSKYKAESDAKADYKGQVDKLKGELAEKGDLQKEIEGYTTTISDLTGQLKSAQKAAKEAGTKYEAKSEMKEFLKGKLHPKAAEKVLNSYEDKLLTFKRGEDGSYDFSNILTEISENEPYMLIQSDGDANQKQDDGQQDEYSKLMFTPPPVIGAGFEKGAKNPGKGDSPNQPEYGFAEDEVRQSQIEIANSRKKEFGII